MWAAKRAAAKSCCLERGVFRSWELLVLAEQYTRYIVSRQPDGGGWAHVQADPGSRGDDSETFSQLLFPRMLSVVASSALSLNIGTSALTSARAVPSMAAALETKFVYERPAPIGTTTGPEYPNTVRASRLSSANAALDGRTLETHHQHVVELSA